MTSILAGTRAIKIAMVAAVTTVFALAYLDLRREQARALDDFTAEQAALAQALAATVGARIDAVLADVAALAALDPPAATALGEHLLQTRSSYRACELIGRDGQPHAVGGQSAIESSPVLRAARTSLLASVEDGAPPSVSAPLRRSPQSRERLRLFLARHDGRAVVLLVDSDGFFQGAEPAATAPMRWLVVDPQRRWLELSPQATEAGSWRDDAPSVSAEVAGLLSRMSSGSAGTMLLGRPAAAALGLDRRMAVAAWAPAPLRAGGPWSVGAVVSAMRVRDRARMAAWRLGAATGMTGLLVSLFGVALARQQRQAQELTAALRLAEATSALRERSEKLVEAIPLGVLALDRDGRVTAVNPYLAQRGVRAKVPLPDALPHATADDLARIAALVDTAHDSRRPESRADLRLRLGHGAGGPAELRDVDAYAVPLGRPLPDVDSFLILHDRTEIRTLERNLARAEKLATIGTLAAGVAHEVGTPLGIISGRAEQLLAKLPSGNGTESARKAVASILTQVDKVSTTIRQLLDFARVRPIEATAVTPAQLLGQASALLDHRFRHAKVSLTVDAPPSVAAVAADPGQLEQVLVNLLINACDACREGGQVSARAHAEGDRVAFEIVDDGVGIAPEHLSSVLDPFFTTKKRGQGTGLGLTIAADIVKNHGGTLEIDSTVGVGTTVRVRLPIAPLQRASS